MVYTLHCRVYYNIQHNFIQHIHIHYTVQHYTIHLPTGRALGKPLVVSFSWIRPDLSYNALFTYNNSKGDICIYRVYSTCIIITEFGYYILCMCVCILFLYAVILIYINIHLKYYNYNYIYIYITITTTAYLRMRGEHEVLDIPYTHLHTAQGARVVTGCQGQRT